jgi:hypothetical protein
LHVVYLTVFGSFACLFPLAFYCLVVASLNSRKRPTLVSGPADFAGVLLATAGFVIIGGPLVLHGVYDLWRRTFLRGGFATIRDSLAESSWPWTLLWVGYFVLVVGGSVAALVHRRSVSAVYNLDLSIAHQLIADVLSRLGYSWTRQGRVYTIGSTSGDILIPPSPTDSPGLPSVRADLELTGIPSLRHLSLRWHSTSDVVREQIEDELRQALEDVESPPNPTAGWLLVVATVLFMILLVILTLFVVLLWNLRG